MHGGAPPRHCRRVGAEASTLDRGDEHWRVVGIGINGVGKWRIANGTRLHEIRGWTGKKSKKHGGALPPLCELEADASTLKYGKERGVRWGWGNEGAQRKTKECDLAKFAVLTAKKKIFHLNPQKHSPATTRPGWKT
jgi:hypothetical protein